MTRTLALGIAFGILAALFIGNVKTARIDRAREVVNPRPAAPGIQKQEQKHVHGNA